MELVSLTGEKYLFRDSYHNEKGLKRYCSLILTVDSINNKVNIEPSRQEEKDTSNDKRPLWATLNKLILEALQFADSRIDEYNKVYKKPNNT